MKQTIKLPLAKSYISSWEAPQGVRELIQNALDCNDHSVYVEGSTLCIDSYDGCLLPKHLMLGYGSKSLGSNTRGGHNEGLALALLVLARSELDVVFYNGMEKWTPYFEYEDDFEEECLHIAVESSVEGEENSVQIRIQGFESHPYIMQTIVNNTLILQDQDYSRHETKYGDVLLEHEQKGRIYCGGLFVGTLQDFDEGFDIKPEYLKVDRDRRMLDHFDVQWICKEVWGEVQSGADDNVAKSIASGLESGSSSLQFLHHADTYSKKVTEEVFDLYEEKFKGKLLVPNHEDKKKLVAEGNNNVEVVPRDSFIKILKRSEGYKAVLLNKKNEKPVDLLADFKTKWYDSFCTDMLHDYDDMTEKLDKVIK